MTTQGVGGSDHDSALSKLSPMNGGKTKVPGIGINEFRLRTLSLQKSMRDQGVDAVYLHAGTNLYYFTGLRWNPSERMVAAIVPAQGEIFYIAPHFELDTLRDYWQVPAEIHGWHEHECPYRLFGDVIAQPDAKILLDESTPYFCAHGLHTANPQMAFGHAQPLTQKLRSCKSEAELDLIRRAHEMTLAVHASAASILKPGITTIEVASFIDKAHRMVGADDGSYFCIVLFGVATSFPHGVKEPQTLRDNDWVLIDTGCLLDGYNSDITRSFCFGTANDSQRDAWEVEKAAQIAAFDAAKPGQTCASADDAARAVLQKAGFGPDYELPGLPHRTGHGCGLDIHEGPNLVRGETTILEPGMVFSSEPMLVIPKQFGVRLEDHFYVTEDGPVWFTQPSKSIDDPFG